MVISKAKHAFVLIYNVAMEDDIDGGIGYARLEFNERDALARQVFVEGKEYRRTRILSDPDQYMAWIYSLNKLDMTSAGLVAKFYSTTGAEFIGDGMTVAEIAQAEHQVLADMQQALVVSFMSNQQD